MRGVRAALVAFAGMRFSGRMARRWMTEKTLGETSPHAGQLAGRLDR